MGGTGLAAAILAPDGGSRVNITTRRKRAVLTAALLAAALTASPRAHASMSLWASMAELVEEADEVVIATTVAKESYYDAHGRIVTDVELAVEQREKGEARAGETLVVRRLGGEVEGIGMLVVGQPSFELGERQLLFLHRAKNAPFCKTVAMSQGRMRLAEQDGETWVDPGGEGLTMVQRDRQGDLVKASRPHRRRLRDVLHEVRALIQAGER